MALSIERALSAREFHAGVCVKAPGLDATGRSIRFRRNGATRTWKRRPGEYEIPVKFGMYAYGRITHVDDVHAAEDCPLNNRIT